MAIEERKTIQFFMNETDKEPGIHVFYLEDDKNIILGQELVLDNKEKVIYYYWPFGEDKILLLMCIDRDASLDKFLEDLSSYDMSVYKRPWPKLMAAIENGISDRLYEPSLIAASFHEKKSYFMTLLLQNISITQLISEETEYSMKNVVKLFQYSVDMLSEIAENDLSVFEKAKVVIAEGTKQARKISRIIRYIDIFS